MSEDFQSPEAIRARLWAAERQIERLQKELNRPDIKAVYGYDAGQRAAAMRCAEIADYQRPDTAAKIREEFNLGP